MRGDRPGGGRTGYDSRHGGGTGYSDGNRSRQRDGFGQPATDSELLRQFASAYEEHVRKTGKLVVPDVAREPRSRIWSSAVLGLVVFVLLLALAMGLAVAQATFR